MSKHQNPSSKQSPAEHEAYYNRTKDFYYLFENAESDKITGYPVDKLVGLLAVGVATNISHHNIGSTPEKAIKELSPSPLSNVVYGNNAKKSVHYILAIAAALIDKGADANWQNPNRPFHSPLIRAHWTHRDTAIVQRLLLLHGADYGHTTYQLNGKDVAINRAEEAGYYLNDTAKQDLKQAITEVEQVRLRTEQAESHEAANEHPFAGKRYQENADYFVKQAQLFYDMHHKFFTDLQNEKGEPHYTIDQSPVLRKGIAERALPHVEKAIACYARSGGKDYANALITKASILTMIGRPAKEVTDLMELAGKYTAPKRPSITIGHQTYDPPGDYSSNSRTPTPPSGSATEKETARRRMNATLPTSPRVMVN